jgi:plastocyanin
MQVTRGWIVLCGLALTACGPTQDLGSSGNNFLIRISRLTYMPQDLTVPPGATIVVLNDDSMPHSVTSEASAGAFTPGAVAGVSFDTGEFSGPGVATAFPIPSTAPDGTVVPFYCSTHKGAMLTPNGSITIRAP